LGPQDCSAVHKHVAAGGLSHWFLPLTKATLQKQAGAGCMLCRPSPSYVQMDFFMNRRMVRAVAVQALKQEAHVGIVVDLPAAKKPLLSCLCPLTLKLCLRTNGML